MKFSNLLNQLVGYSDLKKQLILKRYKLSNDQDKKKLRKIVLDAVNFQKSFKKIINSQKSEAKQKFIDRVNQLLKNEHEK